MLGSERSPRRAARPSLAVVPEDSRSHLLQMQGAPRGSLRWTASILLATCLTWVLPPPRCLPDLSLVATPVSFALLEPTKEVNELVIVNTTSFSSYLLLPCIKVGQEKPSRGAWGSQ